MVGVLAMKINGNLRKYSLFSSVGGGIIALVVFAVAINFFNPLGLNIIDWDDDGPWKNPDLIVGTASTYQIESSVQTTFGNYYPQTFSFEPSITPTQIGLGLSNVDLQGITVPNEIMDYLEEYGFALIDEEYEDIYDIYSKENLAPRFITTDLCLHAYHVLYDISLRLLEGTHFNIGFEAMLQTLQSDQIALRSTVSEERVLDALNKNIAYLTVMLYLLDNTTVIPQEVEGHVIAELANIDTGERADSVIFGYEEDFTQYKVRGHYTRNEILSSYFKAMMYAGRMGFLLQSPSGDIEMGVNHTRMAMLLLSSFNTTIQGSDNVWDYWDRIYQPTAFYVGACDDLTPLEYYNIWQSVGTPTGDLLASDSVIIDIINEAKSYRKPQINSMFVNEVADYANVTQGFRLMGQRFIPDSYIFQQLVHTNVPSRLFPIGLDVLSVFGSSRAAYLLQSENSTYPDYSPQILKLRAEFGNLTDYDWTQNLYWLWLYSLFPLLNPASDGYPGFMMSDAWTDKALMTAMGSWAELRHDTILYAKQSYTQELGIIEPSNGYVEPYPEVYARLASLVRLMDSGLEERNLIIEGFSYKLTLIAEKFDRLVKISMKELENEPLNSSDFDFIAHFGEEIGDIASFHDPEADPWVSEADDRMAIIADVHTDPNSGLCLEVGVGDPYVIYVVVQDSDGNLRLTQGGTFSYYEFKRTLNDRLTDEEWHEMLDSSPPAIPEWVPIPLNAADNTYIAMTIKED